ncbi:hypothetical protein [Tepidibacter hydrothermalis]|uniref:Uncharacterized protein n=1 Tax=Tepidibacter hydrothermalis TaxID=3036126 RepID=A0ABY8E953_9FIRM|nr:hypothetical protein [Tepidibacter hydrothermalis]WFD09346.1 hypothetical protein P4S50_13230 [Tepidibacter hydrothermalis]
MKTKMNNKTKNLAMLLLSGTIMISGFTPAFANSNVDISNIDINKDVIVCEYDENIKMPSFDEFMKEMPDDMKKAIKSDDMKKLESLYNKASKLDEKESFDESDKVWNEFDKLLGMNFETNFEMPSFDEFMKEIPDDMKKDIKSDDMKKLESLYNKASKLDEKESFDESDKVWDEFDKLLGMNFETNFEMPSFDEFMKEMPDDMKKDIKSDDMKKLESLYNKASKLDEKENFDESDKVWDEFDKLLGIDFEEEVK